MGLILSLILVTTTYILVSIVMTGVMNWQTLGAIEGTLIDVGALFFPNYMLVILNIMILIAIVSTIHGILLASSRNLYSAARDYVLPSIFSKIHKKYGTPYVALTFFAVGSCIVLIFQVTIIDLSILCNFTMIIPGLVLAYVPLQLEKKFPELMKKSNFKISKKWILALTIFNVSYAGFSIIIMIAYSPLIIISAAIFYLFAIIYYFYRVKWLKKKDIYLVEICKLVPEETLEV